MLSTENLRLIEEVRERSSLPELNAAAIMQRGDRQSAFTIAISPSLGKWIVRWLDSNQIISYEDGAIRVPNEKPRAAPFDASAPMPLRLVFADALTIWGRTGDDREPVSAERIGEHSILITYQHRKDAAFRGTLIFDCLYRIPIKLVDPTQVVVLQHIEISPPTFDAEIAPPNRGFAPPAY